MHASIFLMEPAQAVTEPREGIPGANETSTEAGVISIPEKKEKRKAKRLPTEMQKRAARNMMGNGGKVAAAMREAGYSAAMIKNSGKLLASEGFRSFFEENLPDNLLVQIHLEGLVATDKVPIVSYRPVGTGKNKKTKKEITYVHNPNFSARHKFLESAYKIKGHMKPDSGNVYVPVQVNVNEDREKYS